MAHFEAMYIIKNSPIKYNLFINYGYDPYRLDFYIIGNVKKQEIEYGDKI